jgi:hypothetical protein
MKVGETVRAVIDGKAVRFTVCEELAFVSNRWVAGREQTRWDEKQVVKTVKGKYVLYEGYVTLWQGEESTSKYRVFDTLEDLVKILDPTDELDRGILQQLGKLDELSEEI